ncbi:hypothetical protein AAFF_G00427680 [Aldrovandia affinis]|uniref:Uncharacterized protein n=1 Tax=Aldrovandia affinis TaxID=143900 RepID=A0AAD7S9U6_9TELE|nr:hypothetical protein AAFF_G00427680 [Aldrovandia affinis]
MKVSALVVFTSVVTSAILAVLLYTKRSDVEALAKKAAFMGIKVRVTMDVLGEYQGDVDKLQKSMDDHNNEVEALTAELKSKEPDAKKKNDELVTCQEYLKKVNEEIAGSTGEIKKVQDELDKEKTVWNKESADLKEEFGKRSKVCDYVKKDSVEGKKLGPKTKVNIQTLHKKQNR